MTGLVFEKGIGSVIFMPRVLKKLFMQNPDI